MHISITPDSIIPRSFLHRRRLRSTALHRALKRGRSSFCLITGKGMRLPQQLDNFAIPVCAQLVLAVESETVLPLENILSIDKS